MTERVGFKVISKKIMNFRIKEILEFGISFLNSSLDFQVLAICAKWFELFGFN